MTTQTETNKHELNGLLVGGIKDNKRSHKWSKYKRIRSGEEKRSGGARRAEEAETDFHRVMGKQRRLWEIWCKGLDLSNGNRLGTRRGQLPLSCSRSLCSLPCQDEEKQAVDWNVKEAEDQWQVENERSKGQSGREMRQTWCQSPHMVVLVHVCWHVPAFACVCVCVFLFMNRSPERQCVDYYWRGPIPIESLHGPPSGIDTHPRISKEWRESRMSER